MSDKFAKRQKGRKCLIDYTKEKASNLSAMEYVKNGRQGDYLACDYDGKPKQVGMAADIKGHDILRRVYSPEGKSPCLNAGGGGNREPKVAQEDLTWRKLTPLECERLQTVPDNYTNHVSNTQRYKMLGNGWTVEVIKHILQSVGV
jgi:site-specific DNA-cytosine methylase